MVPDGWTEHRIRSLSGANGRPVTKLGPFGSALKKSDYNSQGRYKVYGQQQVLAGDENIGDYFVGDEKYAELEACSVLPGDILISTMGSLGSILQLSKLSSPGIINPRLLRLSVDPEIATPEYLEAYLKSDFSKKQFVRFAQGGTMPAINGASVGFIKVSLPPLPEQRKIAEILSTWDKAIETTEALLATARDQKRALMQALLTGKRRFPEFEGEEWREVRLADVCTPKQWPTISQKEMCDTGYPVFGANGFIGYYGQYNHLYPTTVVTCRGATCGTVSRTPAKTYITGNAMSLDDVNTNEVDEDCLFFAVQLRGFNDIISGSAQPQIIGKDIRSVKLELPTIGEQKKISVVLKGCDLETRKLSNEVEILRSEKKALMQQLLTGKRRVVV